MNWKISWKNIIAGLVIAVLLSYFLLSQVKISEIGRALKSFPVWALLTVVGIQLMLNFLKSIRFKTLFNGALGITQLSPIIFLHNLFIIFAPSRSGELAFPYFLKDRFDIPVGRSLSVLVIARVLDVLVILTLVLATVLIGFRDQVGSIRGFVPLSIAGLILLLVFFWMVLKHALWMKGKFGIFFNRWHLYEKKFIGMLIRKFEEVLIALSEIHDFKKILKVSFLTFVIWPITFCFEFVLFRSLGIEVTYWQFLVIAFFPILVNIIPVQSLAGVGTYEATFVGGFLLFGFSQETIVPLAFSVHIILLASTALLGLVGFFISPRNRVPVLENN